MKKDSRGERSLHSRKHKNVVKRKEKAAPEKEDTCTMCGKMCAVRNINKILRGEDVDIMD